MNLVCREDKCKCRHRTSWVASAVKCKVNLKVDCTQYDMTLNEKLLQLVNKKLSNVTKKEDLDKNKTSLFMLADPKNFTKEELGELFCMELEGLTLASFFQAKEKCTTLKCVKYNVRKSQMTLMPPIPVLIIIGIVLLLLSFMLCQEGGRLLKESWQSRRKRLEEDEEEEEGNISTVSEKHAALFPKIHEENLLAVPIPGYIDPEEEEEEDEEPKLGDINEEDQQEDGQPTLEENDEEDQGRGEKSQELEDNMDHQAPPLPQKN